MAAGTACASGAASAAGGLSVLLISAHAANHKTHNHNQNNRDDNRRKIFRQPSDHEAFLLYHDSLLFLCLYSQTLGLLVGTNQHVDDECQHSKSADQADDVQVSSHSGADLIHDQGNSISKHAHIADCNGSPLGAVHLTLDGAHSRKAGCAQQVEDHEAVSGDCSEVLSNSAPDLVAVLSNFFQTAIEHTKGSNNVLLCNEAGNGSHGSLPEVQR